MLSEAWVLRHCRAGVDRFPQFNTVVGFVWPFYIRPLTHFRPFVVDGMNNNANISRTFENLQVISKPVDMDSGISAKRTKKVGYHSVRPGDAAQGTNATFKPWGFEMFRRYIDSHIFTLISPSSAPQRLLKVQNPWECCKFHKVLLHKKDRLKLWPVKLVAELLKPWCFAIQCI